MRLFILGATGGIGHYLVQGALERGHQVTAYVRSPEKIGSKAEGLSVVKGDLFDADQMARSMAGHDAVLSAFGPVTIRSSNLRRQFGQALASAMRKSEVRRVEVVSAAFLFRDAGFFVGLMRGTVFRQMLPDMSGMEEEVSQDDLDWTIVRPPRLTDGPARHAYRVSNGHLPKRGFVISRSDVAHFMIGEVERPAHVKQVVGVAD
jgi:putative NADH-flavin reductase